MPKRLLVYVLALLLVFSFMFTGDLLAENNFLWELSGPEGEFYLLGSFHYMPQDSYPLADVIYDRLAAADVLAVEVDVTEVDQFELQQFIMEEAFLGEDRELKNKISADIYEQVIDISTDYGMTEEDMNNFAPWYASQVIAGFGLEEIGMAAAEGVDIHMLEEAKERGIEIVELETMIAQLEVMSEMDLDIQRAVLRDTVEELEQDLERIKDVVAAWETGEVEPVYEFLFERRDQSQEMQRYYEKIFDEREIEMRDNIISILEQNKKPMVVVGSGHVINDVGLLYLFQEMGYEVNQL